MYAQNPNENIKISENNQQHQHKGGHVTYQISSNRNTIHIGNSFVKLQISGNENKIYCYYCTVQLKISSNNNTFHCNNTVLNIHSSGNNNKVQGFINLINILKESGYNNKWQQQGQNNNRMQHSSLFPQQPRQQFPPIMQNLSPYNPYNSHPYNSNMVQVPILRNNRNIVPPNKKFNGLPPQLIKQLISNPHQCKNSEIAPQCSICLCPIEQGQMETFLFCLHNFHTKCINDWFKKSALCPLCQEDVLKNFQQYQQYQ